MFQNSFDPAQHYQSPEAPPPPKSPPPPELKPPPPPLTPKPPPQPPPGPRPEPKPEPTLCATFVNRENTRATKAARLAINRLEVSSMASKPTAPPVASEPSFG